MRAFFAAIVFSFAVFVSGCAHGTDAIYRRAMVLPENALLPGWQADTDHLIPEKYWGPSIRSLKPLRVFKDRVNIAVVTSEDSLQEHGVYYVSLVSSYLPVDEPGRDFTWDEQARLMRFTFDRD